MEPTNNNKIIWGIAILAVLGVGAWLLMRGGPEEAGKPLAKEALGTHFAGDGMHTVEGTVMLPNPCYTLTVAAEKRAGSPEETLLQFTATKTADVCAEFLYEAPFRLTFNASKDVILSAEINGVPMALNLGWEERISVETGSDFSLPLGDARWVEDMQVVFADVEDDSRCPIDVTCIQAGWATLRFTVGVEAQELLLRVPGDQTVPNAAVVGSYIITLVGVEPEAKSDDPQENRAYKATLRVDIHDSKG